MTPAQGKRTLVLMPLLAVLASAAWAETTPTEREFPYSRQSTTWAAVRRALDETSVSILKGGQEQGGVYIQFETDSTPESLVLGSGSGRAISTVKLEPRSSVMVKQQHSIMLVRVNLFFTASVADGETVSLPSSGRLEQSILDWIDEFLNKTALPTKLLFRGLRRGIAYIENGASDTDLRRVISEVQLDLEDLDYAGCPKTVLRPLKSALDKIRQRDSETAKSLLFIAELNTTSESSWQATAGLAWRPLTPPLIPKKTSR